MVLSIRSGSGAPLDLRGHGRAPRVADAMLLRVMVGFAALVALLFFAVSAHADEIEPEPEPAPIAKPEPEPEPEPEPAPVVVSEDEEPQEPSWIPSIETGFETFDYNIDTTVQNFINPPKYQGAQKEAERQLMYRIGGELMGPMFEDLPGRPRLFVKGGAQFQMFSSDLIFRDGDPYVEGEPESGINGYDAVGALNKDLPDDFVGQGSEISARFNNPSWYAGLGVAFSVPIATNLLLYLKPSVQYSVEKIDLPGGLTTVEETTPPGVVDPDVCGTVPTPDGQPPRPLCLREFVIHRSRATKSTTDHSVGAGLEVALVLFRSARPIRVSLYAEARFLWLVSDDTTLFADSSGIASYSVIRDDLNIKGGGGLRFSWVGYD
jgi:hypothetical protein